jgi:hypothetical protein
MLVIRGQTTRAAAGARGEQPSTSSRSRSTSSRLTANTNEELVLAARAQLAELTASE